MPGCNSKHKKSPFNLIVKEIDINSYVIGNEGSILIFNKRDIEYFDELINTSTSRQIYRINYSDSTGEYLIFGKGFIFLNLIYTMDFEFNFNNYIYDYTNPTMFNVTLFKQRFDNPTRRTNVKHENYPKEYLKPLTSLSSANVHSYQPDISVLEEDLVEIPDDDNISDDMELSFNPIFIPVNVPISTPEVIVIDDEPEEDIVLYESQIILQTPNYSVSLKKRINPTSASTGSPKKSKQ